MSRLWGTERAVLATKASKHLAAGAHHFLAWGFEDNQLSEHT